MAEKSIIIIGAGLAGLSTGCYARMNGYNAHIFEHHSQPGGVAAAWKRGEYLFDYGTHWTFGHKPGQLIYDLFQELGVLPGNSFIDIQDYVSYYDEASSSIIHVTGDLTQLAADLTAISPQDKPAVDAFIAHVAPFRGMDMSMGMDKPRELIGFFEKIRWFWVMRSMFKYFSGIYSKPMSEYVLVFRDPWLREVIKNLFFPEIPAWFACFILALLADGQLFRVRGGSLSFVNAIANRYKALGGEITFNATVEKILVKNNRAVGIRLADGTEHKADIVVSAADGYSTIYKMLGGRYVDTKIDERYKTWKLFKPIIMASYGVGMQFPDEPAITFYKLAQPLRVADEMIDGMGVRIFNYTPDFAPPGKTVVQAMIDTRWDYWSDMYERDRKAYEAEKKAIASELLNRLESRLKGISSKVEVTDVTTPYTTWRYTLNRSGSYEGFSPTPKAVMSRIPKTLPGLNNFYMAGQWVMPGGGMVPCMVSGRHVMQIICKRDGKGFRVISE
jgi:phytoene dehydrogenase-like protein